VRPADAGRPSVAWAAGGAHGSDPGTLVWEAKGPFKFDWVFGPSDGNGDVFARVVAPMLPSLLVDHFDCTVFAYG
jgi:hypothetical protein